MWFEITDSGRLVLRKVTDAAWEYINAELNRLRLEPRHQPWYFSRERYDGTVYITALPQEDKTEFVQIMNCLINEYGLCLTEASSHIVRAWRRDVAYARESERSNERERALEGQIRALKHILRDGCKGCANFCVEQIGDDTNGYCVRGEERSALESSLMSFEHGGYDKRKIFHPDYKFLPCKKCKYLNEGERA